MNIEVTHAIGDIVYVVDNKCFTLREVKIRKINISLYRGMDGKTHKQEEYNRSYGDNFGLGGMVDGIYTTFTNKEDAKAYIFKNL